MTTPLPFVWPWSLAFWIVYAWVFAPEFRIVARASRSVRDAREDRGSLRVVLIGSSVAILAAFVLAFQAPWAALPGPAPVWFFVGMAVLVSGSLLRRHCFRVLGQFFTGDVQIQSDHRVIEAGAYRWVRHPSYSAAFVIYAGIALALGNGLSLASALLLSFPVYAYRARVEERALLSALGEPYARFMATRKRFIPFIL